MTGTGLGKYDLMILSKFPALSLWNHLLYVFSMLKNETSIFIGRMSDGFRFTETHFSDIIEPNHV